MCVGSGAARRAERQQREALELQREEAERQRETEAAARASEQAATLRRRRAERRGSGIASLVNLNPSASTSRVARSLFSPTGLSV